MYIVDLKTLSSSNFLLSGQDEITGSCKRVSLTRELFAGEVSAKQAAKNRSLGTNYPRAMGGSLVGDAFNKSPDEEPVARSDENTLLGPNSASSKDREVIFLLK